MKKYLVFAGDRFYPNGGWDDYTGDADSLEDAVRIGRLAVGDWWEVVDTSTKEIVRAGMQTKGIGG